MEMREAMQCRAKTHLFANPRLCLPVKRLAIKCGARHTRGDSDRRGVEQITSQAFPKTLPTQLLRSDYGEHEAKPAEGQALTVYSLRFSTAHGRGAALNQASSGVNVCLLGRDGRAVMRRVTAVHDPAAAIEQVYQMCEIIDDGVGADCTSARAAHDAAVAKAADPQPSTSGYVLPPRPPPQPRLRFQEGHIDEVCFLAPELGPLAGVLVGTECGTWVLDELHVSSSRSHHIDRFVCRRLLGSQKGGGATYLTPVPPGSVVYGTGESAVVLSKETASTIHMMSMHDYASLKQRLLTTTAILMASGTCVAGIAAGADAALPFALGGIAGFMYQWLLQQSVDNIVIGTGVGSSSAAAVQDLGLMAGVDGVELDDEGLPTAHNSGGSPASATSSTLARKALASPAARLLFVGAVALGAVSMVHGSGVSAAGTVPLGLLPIAREQMWQLMVGLMGFMTYKVALVSVSLSATPNTASSIITATSNVHSDSNRH